MYVLILCSTLLYDIISGNFLLAASKQRHQNIVRPPVKSRCKESAGSYLCSICARKFQHNFKLRHHIRSQHAEIDVETFCPRKTRKTNKIRQWACSCCSKTFTDSQHLRLHVQQKHRDVDMNSVCPYKRQRTEHSSDPTEVHKCNECSKAFLFQKSLRLHVRTKHPSIVPSLQSKAYRSRMKCPGLFTNSSSLICV
jgi:DNA-directed RNA polymerase subunit RPC12/RpoP